MQCPAYNNTRFVDASGYAWQTYCNTDIDILTAAGAASVQVVNAPDILGCMRQCNNVSDCESFRYLYSGPEINEATESATPTAGPATCYLKKYQGATGAAGTTATVHWMSRIARVAVVSTTVTTTTTSSSIAASSPTLVAPTTPWSPAASCSAGGSDPAGGRYTDRFGAVWEVRCANSLDSTPYYSSGTSGQGIYGCWKGCNNRPGCVSFHYEGTVNGMCDNKCSLVPPY
jgi:hypothetical protein